MAIFDVQSFLQGVLDNGWDGIDQAGRKAAEFGKRDYDVLQERREREAKIVKAAAATPEGRALIEFLIRDTLLRSPTGDEYAVNTAEAFAISRARREGADGVAFKILSLLHGVSAVPTPEGGST
jgi:hypothetical protein